MKKLNNLPLSVRLFLFSLGILSLAGCAARLPKLHTIPAGYEIKGDGESVVFGYINTPKGTFRALDKLNKIQLLVSSENPGEDYIIICDMGGSDSYFFVTLPPGTYTIKKIKRGDGYSLPSLSFVAEPGHLNYLGTLKFVAQNEGQSEDIFGRFFEALEEALKRGIRGTTEEASPEDWHIEYDTSDEMKRVKHPESFIKGKWHVGDEYEEAVKVFQQRYPQISQEITKNLFREKNLD